MESRTIDMMDKLAVNFGAEISPGMQLNWKRLLASNAMITADVKCAISDKL